MLSQEPSTPAPEKTRDLLNTTEETNRTEQNIAELMGDRWSSGLPGFRRQDQHARRAAGGRAALAGGGLERPLAFAGHCEVSDRTVDLRVVATKEMPEGK